MLQLLADPVAATVVAAIVGLCVGSFLNVVIHRLPKMLERGWQDQCAELRGEAPAPGTRYDLVVPRSACPSCGHAIGVAENIPVVSWLVLRGKCKACKTPISARYPAVEILGGTLGALAIWHFGPTWQGVAACAFLWTLVALTFIDFDTQLLPDDMTLPLLWGGLLANLYGLFVPLREAVIGAIAGYLTLWSIYWLFKLIRGKEGMGYGDFKLLAALGAWLGWKMLPLIVLGSSLVGAGIGIALVVIKGIWGGFKNKMITSLLGIIGMGLGVFLFGLAPSNSFWLAVVGMGILGVMHPIANGPIMAIMQSKIAPEMQGRVMGLTNSICAMMMPLALLIAAPVAEFVSLQLWYWLGGTLTMLIAGGAFLIPAIMTLDKQKHETIPQPAMQA